MIRVFFFLSHFIALTSSAQIYPLSERVPREDMGITQQSNENSKWLLDDKFGMFIHWGLYSGPAYGEWYMNWAGIPINEYKKFAYPESGDKQFTADKFHPDEWAQLAKDAGMRYMNLTTMHHDGFALFDSKHPNAFTSQQTLGRDIQKIEFTMQQLLLDRILCIAIERRIQIRRAYAKLMQVFDLILHQCDQRRNDHTDAGAQ